MESKEYQVCQLYMSRANVVTTKSFGELQILLTGKREYQKTHESFFIRVYRLRGVSSRPCLLSHLQIITFNPDFKPNSYPIMTQLTP
jgi:hypothetical protein